MNNITENIILKKSKISAVYIWLFELTERIKHGEQGDIDNKRLIRHGMLCDLGLRNCLPSETNFICFRALADFRKNFSFSTYPAGPDADLMLAPTNKQRTLANGIADYQKKGVGLRPPTD